MTLLRSASGYSHHMVKSELAKCQESLKKAVAEDDTLTVKETSYSYMEKISSLEDLITEMAGNCNQRAVDLKTQLNGALKLSSSIKQCWTWLHQTTQMAQLHMRNASTFHLFYANASELQTSLDQIDEGTSLFHFDSTPKTVLFELKNKYDFIIEKLSHYQHLLQKSEWLVSNCYSVIPIYLREEKVQQPTKGICLCNYESFGAKIEVDETILLLDNTDPLTWTVKNKDGEQLRIPSIACLIPGPDQRSVTMAFKLRDDLIEKWKEDLMGMRKLVVELLLSICQAVMQDDIQVHPDCVQDLRKTVTRIEEIACLEDDEHNERQFSEILSSFRRHLDTLAGKVNRRSPQCILTRSDVTNICGLLSAFKDYVRNCHSLDKKSAKGRTDGVSICDQPNQTEVSKLFNRLSTASTDTSSTVNDALEDPLDSTLLPKCVSRLYWNLSSKNTKGTEKFVDTVKVSKDIPIPFKQNETFYSSKIIPLKGDPDISQEGVRNLTVSFFQVSGLSKPKLVDHLIYYNKDLTSTSAQTDSDIGEVNEEYVIEKAKTRSLQSAPPKTPTPTKANASVQTWISEFKSFRSTQTCDTVCSYGDTSTLSTSAQTTNRDIKEAQVVYSIGKHTRPSQTDKNALSTHATQTATSKTANAHHSCQTITPRSVNRGTDPLPLTLKDATENGSTLEETTTSVSQTSKVSVVDKATNPDFRLKRDKSSQSSSVAMNDKGTVMTELSMTARKTQVHTKVSNVQIQTRVFEQKDANCQWVISRSTRSSQTSTDLRLVGRKNGGEIGTQTDSLSYEIVTSVLISGEEAKDCRVLSVKEKVSASKS